MNKNVLLKQTRASAKITEILTGFWCDEIAYHFYGEEKAKKVGPVLFTLAPGWEKG
jgi:hypothetical protein